MERQDKINYILADCNENEVADFKRALKDNLKVEFIEKNYICNGERNFFSNIRRMFTYFFVGFKFFFKRKKCNIIICWQQFFGIFIAFFARFFKVKKNFKLIVMTFIYKKKKGFIGKIYDKFIRYAITSKYIDIITVSASTEIDKYSQEFNVNKEKFKYLAWSRNADSDIKNDSEKGNYVISIGRSNRDYDFLIEALKDYNCETVIYTDVLKKECIGNCNITGTVCGANEALTKSFCVVIPIKDTTISAGQTLLINAMISKKPVIITASKGLTDDYIEDGKNGIIINKSKNELIEAIEKLKKEEYYNYIAENAYNNWKENYTIYSMGKKMASFIEGGNLNG